MNKKLSKNEKIRLFNISRKSAIKTFLKNINLSILNDSKDIVEKKFIKFQSFIDRQASKRIIHKNKSSRIKSRLIKIINKI